MERTHYFFTLLTFLPHLPPYLPPRLPPHLPAHLSPHLPPHSGGKAGAGSWWPTHCCIIHWLSYQIELATLQTQLEIHMTFKGKTVCIFSCHLTAL